MCNKSINIIEVAKRYFFVVALLAMIGGISVAKSTKPSESQNTELWTRISEDGNEWVEGDGGAASCQPAERVCQYLFAPEYDPNDNEYGDNIENGSQVPGAETGFKPQL